MAELASRALNAVGPGDAAIAWIAERQHSIVSLEQAAVCGLSAKAAYARRRTGLWRVLHNGIYLVGPQPATPTAQVLAAVASCAPFAAASDMTAVWLYRAIDRFPRLIDVLTLDRHNPGDRPGVRIHRSRRPPPAIRWLHGIPVTSPEETLLSVAAVLPEAELEAIWALLVRNGATSHARIREAVAQSPPRKGIVKLRAIAAPSLTRSPPERRLLELIRAAELPPPQTNVQLEGKEVDFWWPGHRLVVEVDAFGTHGSPEQFEADRITDARFDGDVLVRRFTRRRIEQAPYAVIARLAWTLAQR